MDQDKVVKTSIAQHFKLSHQHSPKTADEQAYIEKIPSFNVVGSLMYMQICTRPYLAYAVSFVSRYMTKLGRLR